MERFEGGFATDGGEVGSLEEVVLGNYIPSSWWMTGLNKYLAIL